MSNQVAGSQVVLMLFYVGIPLVLIVLTTIYVSKVYSGDSNYDVTAFGKLKYIEIQVPKDMIGEENTSAFAAEQMFLSLHGLLQENPQSQEHFSFEIVSDASGIRFYFVAPESIVGFVQSQVYAQYPNAKLHVRDDYVDLESVSNLKYVVSSLDYTKEDFFPIKSFRDFEVDTLANLTSTLSEFNDEDTTWLQFVMRPTPDGWQSIGQSYVDTVKETGSAGSSGSLFGGLLQYFVKEMVAIAGDIPTQFLSGPSTDTSTSLSSRSDVPAVKLTTLQELELSTIENKLSKLGYECVVRIIGLSPTTERLENNFRSINASLKQYSTSISNELLMVSEPNYSASLEDYKARIFDPSKAVILTSEELATIFHLPASRESAPNVTWVHSKTGEPPTDLPTKDCTYLGDTVYRGKTVRFGLNDNDDRLRHMYLIGKTGAGKSTLLRTMVVQDILKGNGVGVLDPHGETIDSIMDQIPDNRIDDVVMFDPADTENPVGLNLLELNDPSQKNLVASALLAAIKHHFDYSWGPRLEYLLNYALLTLLDVPGTSMLGITRLLEDQNYLKYILHHVKDPGVIKFWEQEYRDMKGNQRLVTEAVAPIQNKVNRFLASTTIRNILGQRKSTIDIWNIMQSKKIFLINLSKGKIGSDNANLLGALIVSRIQSMALQRAKLTPEERIPFYLYVDEFQNFATGSFSEILSESRKYKLGLYLTHQYTAQLPEDLLSAVFGNVGTIATFSLGAPDARILANEFAPYFDAEDIISLEKFHIYIKMMMNGKTTLPFSAEILQPWNEQELLPTFNNRQAITERSRQKYGVDKEYVEELIGRWFEKSFDKGMAISEGHKSQKGK